jgi:DNA polymerase III delta prime subunit
MSYLLQTNKVDLKTKQINLPLVEKYRPKIFNDILFDDFLRNKIKNILKSKQLQNMVITGEPSTGKTTTVLYLAKKIYKDDYDNNVLELNASYDRGLTMIQQTILPFCKKKSNNYKLIILDEADSITQKAQNLLNNIIAEYKKTTRFIFICNEGFKINESIQSRCILLYFPRISKKNIRMRLKEIATSESIKYTEDGLSRLMFCSNYDIRQCINNIECIMSCNYTIDEETIDNMMDIPKLFNIRKILNSCIQHNLKEAIDITYQLYEAGYSANDILLTFLKYIENFKDYKEFEENNVNEIELYKIVSSGFIKVNNGIDNFLQLCSCISSIYILLNPFIHNLI